MYYDPDAKGTHVAPRWTYLLCGIGLFIYQSLDAIGEKIVSRTSLLNWIINEKKNPCRRKAGEKNWLGYTNGWTFWSWVNKTMTDSSFTPYNVFLNAIFSLLVVTAFRRCLLPCLHVSPFNLAIILNWCSSKCFACLPCSIVLIGKLTLVAHFTLEKSTWQRFADLRDSFVKIFSIKTSFALN